MMHENYRAEIDGLRALAVISVLAYHLDKSWVPAGFLGVDVFFVISGYLITSNIVREKAEGRFSIADFWGRRVRRIIPPLLPVLVVTTVVSYFVLLPGPLEQFAGSLVSSLGFGSNIWFWLEDGYMTEPSAMKPLLHTWSLAVEEQFYVLLPLLMSFIGRFRVAIFSCLALCSLILAQWMSEAHPDAAFFLLPTRAWELLAGALLALLPVWKGRSWPAFLGLALILGTILLESSEMKHPSIGTLPLVAGAVLFIGFARHHTFAAKSLSFRPLVFVGLISYSLYLWHWPVIVFAKMMLPEFNLAGKLICGLLATVLATVSYWVVEPLFRDRQRLSWSKLCSLLGSGGAVTGAAAYVLVVTQGAAFRLDGVPAFADFKTAEQARLTGEESGVDASSGGVTKRCYNRTIESLCIIGDGHYVTLGDSYMGQYEYELAQLAKAQGHGLIAASHSECPFILAEYWFGKNDRCVEINQSKWKMLQGLVGQRTVVLSLNARLFTVVNSKGPIPSREKMAADFRATVRRIRDLGHEVVFITTPPRRNIEVVENWKAGLSAAAWMKQFRFDPVYDRETELNAREWENLIGLESLEAMGVKIISASDALCGELGCLNIAMEGSVYNKTDHLSGIGARKVLANWPNP